MKLFRSYDVYVTPERLSRYRQHAGSVSAKAAAAGEYDRMRAHSARRLFLAWVEDYLHVHRGRREAGAGASAGAGSLLRPSRTAEAMAGPAGARAASVALAHALQDVAADSTALAAEKVRVRQFLSSPRGAGCRPRSSSIGSGEREGLGAAWPSSRLRPA